VVEQAGELELGEDVPYRRAGHAEPVPIDQRLAADRRRGGDVFLDDGPQDQLCAKVQGAGGATDSTRQGLVLQFGSGVVSTLPTRVLTLCRHRSPSRRGCQRDSDEAREDLVREHSTPERERQPAVRSLVE